uniref:PNPLA domain-containing protein n=1 Tax=Steinernema glaseri TaxID=37863 RepID=A0A1I7ZDW5_9BILA
MNLPGTITRASVKAIPTNSLFSLWAAPGDRTRALHYPRPLLVPTDYPKIHFVDGGSSSMTELPSDESDDS